MEAGTLTKNYGHFVCFLYIFWASLHDLVIMVIIMYITIPTTSITILTSCNDHAGQLLLTEGGQRLQGGVWSNNLDIWDAATPRIILHVCKIFFSVRIGWYRCYYTFLPINCLMPTMETM